MKITRISTGEHRVSGSNGVSVQDFCLYLFRSSVMITYEGEEREYDPGTAIVYTGGRRQYFRSADSRGLRYDTVRFRMNSADRQYAASLDLPFDQPVTPADEFIIASAIKSMEVHGHTSPGVSGEIEELFMRIIMLSISEAASVKATEGRSIPKYPELIRLREEIYSDPMQEWSVEEQCALLDVSRAYFHRIYLEAFGVTFRRDVIESRLLYASELLESTELTVYEIAETCGYESDSYFMRQFKQYRGCTPTEYRRRVKS